ncbi:natural cytotoxicity triggering receptor 2 [Chionomys nivalis]|uniref:natural cytotoxicity triggering receptor 2 n=1 Tax=Chionomys nivalis TaxID=269649 RepID=UPI0025966E6B|nr:natural cytotoxicity triggering receptor 2 [Chionomys nivalis]
MAWEATYLLSPILLVLLVSGSCTEDTELLQTTEDKKVFVKCQYDPSQYVNVKVLCQEISAGTCKLIVTSVSKNVQWPKFSIKDAPGSDFFTVTMTALTMGDSGLYFCGIVENDRTVAVLRRFRLVVSRGHSNTTASAMIPTWTRTEAPPFNTTKDMSTSFSRVSISSMVVLIVCGLLSKTLIFTVSFAVTERSFGGQTVMSHNSDF